MLVLIVAVAITASFIVEIAFHLFSENYEIEWATPAEDGEEDLTQDILSAMRKRAANLNAR